MAEFWEDGCRGDLFSVAGVARGSGTAAASGDKIGGEKVLFTPNPKTGRATVLWASPSIR